MAETAPSEAAIQPTKETYEQFQQAYEVLNQALFAGELPNCLITLQRRNRTYGYFCGDRFGRSDGQVTDEIALNPRHFHDRSVPDVLSTLAHEMVHLWQHHFGTPGRGRYHNREWADRMKAIGLQPTSTGKPDGEETGDSMDHLIVTDGAFDRTVKELLAGGFSITWIEKPPCSAKSVAGDSDASSKGGDTGTPTGTRSGKRAKYTCPSCGLNAWAKHRVQLLCGADMRAMDPAG
jgi:predicted SprT family Zn-dependent metalloprotease